MFVSIICLWFRVENFPTGAKGDLGDGVYGAGLRVRMSFAFSVQIVRSLKNGLPSGFWGYMCEGYEVLKDEIFQKWSLKDPESSQKLGTLSRSLNKGLTGEAPESCKTRNFDFSFHVWGLRLRA